MTVTRQDFRDAMARLGAAVNIITTGGPAGRGGFTASAVCSVTDEPPTLLVCMNRGDRGRGDEGQCHCLRECRGRRAEGRRRWSSPA